MLHSKRDTLYEDQKLKTKQAANINLSLWALRGFTVGAAVQLYPLLTSTID